MKNKIIVVLGPTASGKTKLSVDLCKKLNGEVISADSMQVYKDISIISAMPTNEEKCNIKHHIMGFLEKEKTFSVSDFKTMAQNVILDITKRGKIPIVCGGTGLYIDCLINNIQFYSSTENKDIREKYIALAKEKGNDFIFNILKEKDENISKTIHQNNVIKVARALEIIDTTGKTMTEIKKNANSFKSEYDVFFIGLNFLNRQTLYNRINKRVDIMLKNNILQEAKSLYKNKNISKTIKQAIGYKEFLPYFEGFKSLEEVTDDIKKFSRRYAKRQITWFKRNDKINWFYFENYNNYDIMFNEILGQCQSFLK